MSSPDLCFDDQLFQNSLSSRCRLSSASIHAVPLPDAEKQRDLAQPGFEVDDDGRSLAEARQLDGRS